MISIKSEEKIKIMAEGGRILAGIMKDLEKRVKPGVATKELDRVAETLILKSGSKCSFKGYEGYPCCLCTSINEEIVHAVPSDRILREGDILSLDLGLFYKGFHADMAKTLPVGRISSEAKRLIEVTRKALEIGIKEIKPGNKIGDISRAIQKYVENQGFNVVRELCGHGIGRELHEAPEILNSVSLDKGTVDKVKFVEDGNIKINEGMILCLEPMVTVGDWHIKKSGDGHGYKTADGRLSAHFEHTIAITKDGIKILTMIK
jgi:methionyl aminopeptidase